MWKIFLGVLSKILFKKRKLSLAFFFKIKTNTELSFYSDQLPNIKSNNVQYNMRGHWVAGTNDSSINCLMFQVLFFSHDFLQNSLQKSFQFIFYFFYDFTKMNIKSFGYPKSIRNYEKEIMLGTSDAWLMSRSSHRLILY